MTQSSVPSLNAAAAPAPLESTPVALSQASGRAEFATRLLAALAELQRAAGAATPATDASATPLDAETPVEGAVLEEQPIETQEESVESLGLLAVASDVPVSFTPLVFPELEREARDTRADTDADEGEVGSEGDASLDGLEARPSALRLPSFATQDTVAPRATEAPAPASTAAQTHATSREELEAAALEIEATREARERAPETQTVTTRSTTPEAGLDPALTRPEASAPNSPGARAEGASAPAGRVLPELPVRNENEIVDQVRFLLNRKGGQAHIELHPPQLGQVGLRISVSDHAVRLEITADRLQVAELLARHLPDLQNALAAQGLQIDRAQVDLRERGTDGRERGGDPNEPGPQRERTSDSDTSERQSGYARRALPAYSLGAVDVHA